MSSRTEIKNYLKQAYLLDQQIDSKIEQVASLHTLAAKATSTLSDMPPSGSRNVHRMEDIILKVIKMENEINADIDDLVDLKEDIRQLIGKVENTEYRYILEQRYMNFRQWEKIAADMGYSLQYLFRLHNRALDVAAEIYSAGKRGELRRVKVTKR